MAYTDTLIVVADDSTAETAVIPTMRGKKKSIHLIQYELLTENPYTYTHEDLIYEVHVRRQSFSAAELAERGTQIRTDLLSKEHACLRASALTKKYGWGAYYNEAGKIALVPMESAAYQTLLAEAPTIKMAMRSKRK